MKSQTVGVLRATILGMTLLLVGCNTIIYDRSEATRRSSLELCRLYVHYFQPQTIVDELNLRISRGEFTIQQCREAGDAEEKRQIAAASGANAGVAYQLGHAIGSRGRVMSTYPPTPTPAPNYAPIPPSKPYTPPAPFVPIPYVPSYTLLSATPSNVPEAGYFMTTCRYVGSPTVIRVQTGYPCPASVQQ